MAEGGRRRSARLLALHEQKNKKQAHVPMQATGGQESKQKRSRKEKVVKSHEADSYTVSDKATPSNASADMTYQEAGELQTEVQNALKCLENKQTSYEKLSTWSQTYFNTTQQEVRKDSNVRTLINAAQPHGQQDSSHPMIDGDMNHGGIGTNVAANGRILSLNQNSTTMRTPQTRAASRPPYRKDSMEHSSPSTEERRFAYKLGNSSGEPIVSMVYQQPAQLVYNNNGPSYKESLKNYVKDAGHLAKQAAEHNFQEYARQEKAQTVPFNQTPYIPTDNISFFPQFGSCSSNPSFSRDAAAEIAARVMNFSPTSATASKRTSGKLFPSTSTHDKLGFNVIEEPSCKLETDELLRMFSQIGTPEFLERHKNNLTSTLSQGMEPNQSSSTFVNCERDHAMVTAMPNYTVASSMTHVGQYPRWEPPKQISIYDILFLKPQSSDSKTPEQNGLADPKAYPHMAPNTSSSRYLLFGEYASSDPKSSEQMGLEGSEPQRNLAPTGSSSGKHGFSPYASPSNTFELTTLNLFK